MPSGRTGCFVRPLVTRPEGENGAPAELAGAPDASARLEGDAEGLLPADVRSPVGIPKQYRPTETSIHELMRVELTAFGGPLDLLLYLIRAHDIDIFDIPISFIIEKYLAMLDTLSDLPIDVAADFLVMAAELAHIKSKMLLPPKEGVAVEADEVEEGDPRAELVRRLLEYQKYRTAAGILEDRGQLGRDVFVRPDADQTAAAELEPELSNLSIFRLVEAMADVLARLTPEKQHEVIADSVTISERIQFILDFGAQRNLRFPFIDLFAGMESRRVVVMTFLAILEMARTQMIKIEQEGEPGGDELPAPAQGSAGAFTPLEPEGALLSEPLEVNSAAALSEAAAGEGALAEGAAGPEATAEPVVEATAEPAAEAMAESAAEATAEPAAEATAEPASAAEPDIDADGEELDADEEPSAVQEPPRRVRQVATLTPLRAPAPGEIMLVLTGRTLEEAEQEVIRDDYG